MLYSLLDGHASNQYTELATVAEVSASTASAHLNRLKTERLVKVFSAREKHRYYRPGGPQCGPARLEGLSVACGEDLFSQVRAENYTEPPRAARTCYDHIAGTLGVLLHDRFTAMNWM